MKRPLMRLQESCIYTEYSANVADHKMAAINKK